MDSDDEYDRKRRDKFRGERSAGADSYRADRRDERRVGGSGGGSGRDEWMERGRGRPDYYRGGGARERYSPGRELPPPKRMRPDWNEDRPRYGGHDAYGMYGWGHDHYPPPMHGMHGFGGGGGGGHVPMSAHNREAQQQSDMQTQPPMLTLKQFLDTQDDGISDAEVLRKYSEYKLEFKRQQLNEFFVAHKDEEWFKNKYHPEEAQKRKEEQSGFLKKRVDVFMELLEKGLITNVSVDINQSDQLLRLLDTVVIKLEGGTDDDLKILDEKPTDIIRTFESNLNMKKNIILKDQDDDDVIITDDIKPKVKENDEDISWEPIPSKVKKISKPNNDNDDDEENWDNADNDSVKNDENDKSNVEEENWEPISSKVKINKNPSDNDDENWDDANTSHEDEKQNVDDENKEKFDVKDDSPKTKVNDGERDGWEDDENSIDSSNKKMPEKKRDRSNSESSTSSQESKKEKKTEEETQTTDKEIEDKYGVDKNDLNEDKTSDATSTHNEQETTTVDEKQEENDDKTETIDLDKLKDPDTNDETNKPRALHRTSSIFLRNLAPTITKSEIEGICKRYDGFLRVAIADPLVERRWFRRGWVTFQRDVNIKEICWNLNNIRLRDCEMGAIVNRDLSRRVRPVNGVTAHKTIVRNDIKLLARIALNFDEKFKLWTEKQNSEDGTENGDVRKQKSFGFNSKNPVLQNITDYLIEEASAEEDELLGLSSETTSNEGEILERDPQLIQVLDKLILYMRVVHSLDYYNHCEYPYEDEMPNRCGIIHARGPPPSNKITKQDIEEYIKNFESKMTSFLTKATPIAQEELKNLGCKDAEAEVEKFVQANTQELSKDKWLCPLSGKKFKGPEFIKKHIFNKHMEKVDEVRKEVEYFNNYLKDPKRPQLPEHPGNTKRNQPPSDPLGGPQMPYRPGYPAAGYAPPYAAYAPPIIAPPRPRAFGNRRMPSINHRPMIHYRDLDALDDTMDTL